MVELLENTHGSGLDGTAELHLGLHYKRHSFIVKHSFHCIDEKGFYCRWSDFTLIVPLDNPFDFKIKFNGKVSTYLGIKYGLREFLEQLFHESICDVVDVNLYE